MGGAAVFRRRLAHSRRAPYRVQKVGLTCRSAETNLLPGDPTPHARRSKWSRVFFQAKSRISRLRTLRQSRWPLTVLFHLAGHGGMPSTFHSGVI